MLPLECFDGNGYPLELSFDNEFPPDETLEVANQQIGFAKFQQFAHDDQTVTRANWLTEPNVIEPAEPDDRIAQEFVLVGRVAADLGDGFEHDHAGHQRHSGHVASDPKFVVGDVFVADTDHVLWVFVDDRRQLLHLEALGIVFSDLMNIGRNPIEIDRVGVHDELFTYHAVCPRDGRVFFPENPSCNNQKSACKKHKSDL